MNLTCCVPQRVNLLSALGRNSHTRKDSERIFRLNEVMFVAFKLHVTNKYFHLLKPCRQSLLFPPILVIEKDPLKVMSSEHRWEMCSVSAS